MTKNNDNCTLPLPIRISAPGKVILYGEHSVVYERWALVASLGLRTYVTLEPNTLNNSIIFDFASVNCRREFCIQELKENLISKVLRSDPSMPDNVAHDTLLAGIQTFYHNKDDLHVLCALYLMCGILSCNELQPIILTVTTDLQIGSGTGSSGSLAVCLASAFLHLIRFKDLWSKAGLAVISKWAFNAERLVHGYPSGIDTTISTFGGVLRFKRHSEPIMVQCNLCILLIDTQVNRNTKCIVERVKNLKDQLPDVVECIMDAINAVTVDASTVIEQSANDKQDEILRLKKLSKLMTLNHNLLRCLDVSHPKLETACQILSEYDLSGKLTGAGGGGYAISIIPPDYQRSQEVIAALQKHDLPASMVQLGGSGVKVVE